MITTQFKQELSQKIEEAQKSNVTTIEIDCKDEANRIEIIDYVERTYPDKVYHYTNFLSFKLQLEINPYYEVTKGEFIHA